MAGVFQENVILVNRAPVELSVQFDGQSKTLVPGENIVPAVVVMYAKNQNPIMGKADPYNPHVDGGLYLVGVKGSKDPIDALSQEEWEEHLSRPCREDEQRWFEDKYGNDPKAKMIVRGKGKKSTASSRYEAGTSGPGNASFSNKP